MPESKRTSIACSAGVLELFHKKRAEAIGHLGRDVTNDEFLMYMLEAEKWRKK